MAGVAPHTKLLWCVTLGIGVGVLPQRGFDDQHRLTNESLGTELTFAGPMESNMILASNWSPAELIA